MKVTVLNALVVMCWCAIRALALPDVILIGGIFDIQDHQQEMAFRYAVERVNSDNTLLPRSRLEHRSINLPNDDSFHAAKKVCELLREGVAAIFGPQTENTANHIQSICDAMEIPHIETRWHYTDRRDAYSINLHPYPPSLGQVYKGIIKKLAWKKFVILYDDNESLVRMQSILKESSWEFVVRKLPEGNDYRPMLKDIKLSGISNILLDVSQDKIFRVLDHAGLVGLMTDYQKYFITNLDLNQIELERFKGSGTNITGIQLVDQKAHKTKTLIENWKRGELRFNHHLPDFNFITTDAALIYDAVILFASALTELENVKNVDISQLYCEGDKTWQHGSTLVNYMKLYSSPTTPVTHHPRSHSRSQSSVIPLNGVTRWSPRRGEGMDMRTTGSGMRGGGGYFGGHNMSTVHHPIMGLSGLIKFNEEGFRSDFALDILEMEHGDLKKVGKWTKAGGAYFTRAFVETQEMVETTLKDRNRVVCTALTPPYTMEKKSSETLTGNDKYEGFCIDLIDMIARMYKFNYTIMITPDGAYGSTNEKGEWNGIVKQLIDHKADLGIVDFTITYQREGAVDFTMPFMNLGISIVYKRPQKKSPSLFSFMSPFSVSVWIYMATAYLGVSVLLFILARMTPDEWTNPLPCITEPEELENCFTLVNSMWFVIATYLCQGADIAPRAVSTRIVAGIWWFFTLIMISSYTANLAAFLTVERMDSPIESAEDLAKQTRIKYGLKEGGSTYAFFQESTYDTYKKMWQTMSSQRPSVFTSSNELGVERVKKSNGLYAFLMESVSIEYVVERNCDLMRIGDLLDSKSYGIALPPGSPYTSVISSAILMLKENGTLHQLKEYWWKKTEGVTCQTEEKKDPASAAELGLDNVGGVFVVMVGGIALACLTACCEFFWKARKLATDEGMSFGTELRKELLFVINCRENSKPVRKRALPASTDSSSIYGSSNYGYSGNGKN